MSVIAILFSAIFINNIILMRFLGLCSFFGVSDRLSKSIGMSVAVIFVMCLATSITYFIYHFLLVPLNLVFLRTLTFILTIASTVQLIEIFMRKKMPSLYKALGVYLPLITTNCAILAVTFLNIDYNYNFIQSISFAIGTGLGYTIAIILFTGIRESLKYAPIPKSFQGYGIVFIIASLMSLSFIGLSGLFGF